MSDKLEGHGLKDAFPTSVTPEGALIRGIADGPRGDMVGVFGFSVAGVGIFGRAESGLAGRFEGSVEVAGELTLNGLRLSQLIQRFEVLVQRLDALERRQTTKSPPEGLPGAPPPRLGADLNGPFSVRVEGKGFKAQAAALIIAHVRTLTGNLVDKQVTSTSGVDGHFTVDVSFLDMLPERPVEFSFVATNDTPVNGSLFNEDAQFSNIVLIRTNGVSTNPLPLT